MSFSVMWVYLVIASYFYVLPLGRITTVDVTDFRAYDLMIMLGFLLVILPNLSAIGQAISTSPWLRAYMLFCAWAFLTLAMVIVTKGLGTTIIATARWGRFLAYGLVHATILVVVNERKQLVNLTWLFFLLAAFEGLLSTLQSLGIVPQLWPDYWLVVYGSRPVGTLGPHHLHAGTVSVMGASLGIALIRHYKWTFLRAGIALAIAPMVYTSFALGSRSGWFGLAAVVIYFVIFSRQKLRAFFPLIFIALGILAFVQLAGEQVSVIALESVNYRVVTEYQASGIEGLGSGRVDIWAVTFTVIWRKPWVLLTGTGIQNINIALPFGGAMHNNYLQALIETGIIGLILYIRMLYFMWKRSKAVEGDSDSAFGRDLAAGFQAAFFAILLLNLFNENFYMQYSSFSLSGQIMVYAALALHPFWTEQRKEEPQEKTWMTLG